MLKIDNLKVPRSLDLAPAVVARMKLYEVRRAGNLTCLEWVDAVIDLTFYRSFFLSIKLADPAARGGAEPEVCVTRKNKPLACQW